VTTTNCVRLSLLALVAMGTRYAFGRGWVETSTLRPRRRTVPDGEAPRAVELTRYADKLRMVIQRRATVVAATSDISRRAK
jgi:hypothetical protein